MSVAVTKRSDEVWVVMIERPGVRNAVNRSTAEALSAAFEEFEHDPDSKVAVLAGAGGTFCSGADLKAIAEGDPNRLSVEGAGPMGPSRTLLGKPVIAAISGYAVAGGLELALWCDLRVAEEDSVMGIFCRRWGVPLIDGGTVRLPRLIGHSRALDLILTGRPVTAQEALQMGLVNRLAAPGEGLEDAIRLAEELAALPQTCLLSDRMSTYEQWDLDFSSAMRNEFEWGQRALADGAVSGAAKFASGAGRHGAADEKGE
ncbi:MAG: crotonase/enoyl-CoA hydratase family protein [Myxococcales bacterium]|nr:crotonase/enoyl-CoA hydratase family protein [Myxococcales bacterium]